MAEIRILNDQGVIAFSKWLGEERSLDHATDPPFQLLDSPSTSERFAVPLEIDELYFDSKFEVGRYFYLLFQNIEPTLVARNRGLWSWLALFLIEQVAPVKGRRRQIGEDYRYLLSDNFRHDYRHLVAGPWKLYQLHKTNSRTMLAREPSVHGDFAEQLSSRLDLITNTGFIGAIDRLYWDPAKGSARRGAATAGKPGTLRRLITISQQLERTYDLQSMRTEELLALLPKEFDRWKRG